MADSLKKSSGLMTAYELVDWLKEQKYHVSNRVVIEPRSGGLIEVYQFDENGDELGDEDDDETIGG